MKNWRTLLVLLCALMLCLNVAAAAKVTGTGTSTGFAGPVTVTVTLTDGVITNVAVDAPDETQGIGSVAADELATAIVKYNSINVEIISGATLTSNGVLAAAKNALKAAGVNLDDYMDEIIPDPEVPTTPEETEDEEIVLGPNMWKGTALGFNGDVTAVITLIDGKITAMRVVHDESPGIGSVAADELAAAIVKYNSINVDTVTNATYTSKAVLAAAKNALKAAGVNPNDYMGRDDETIIPGDPDNDGKVTIKDSLCILRYFTGETINIDEMAADVNNDSEVTLSDVLLILQHDAGWDVKLN